MRVKVVVLAGLHADVVDTVAQRMRQAGQDEAALIEHDLRGLGDGRVIRTLRDARGSQELVVDLAHGCVGCTLRDSVLPALAECARHARYSTVILALPAAVEPEPVARELARGFVHRVPIARLVQVHAVVTALDPGRLLADIDGRNTLIDRNLACAPEDGRFVAEVLLRQIEHADILMGPHVSGVGMDLLAHLNPGAELLAPRLAGGILLGSRRHDPAAAAMRSEPATACAPLREISGSVSTIIWRARRPLHPGRFHAGIRRLVQLVIRCRGHVRPAWRPGTLFSFATYGPSVQLGAVGPWLDEGKPDTWATAGQGRRGRAALCWDPDVGERGNELVLTGVDVDAGEIHALLDSMTLTDKEYAGGLRTWQSLPNPFAAPPRAASNA